MSFLKGVKLYTHIHSSIICRSQKVETTQTSTKEWTNKQYVVYAYNWVLFNLKKEWNSGICHQHRWTLKISCYGKQDMQKWSNIALTHLHEILRIIKFIKAGRMVVTRCMESLYFTSPDFRWDEEKILEWMMMMVVKQEELFLIPQTMNLKWLKC